MFQFRKKNMLKWKKCRYASKSLFLLLLFCFFIFPFWFYLHLCIHKSMSVHFPTMISLFIRNVWQRYYLYILSSICDLFNRMGFIFTFLFFSPIVTIIYYSTIFSVNSFFFSFPWHAFIFKCSPQNCSPLQHEVISLNATSRKKKKMLNKKKTNSGVA